MIRSLALLAAGLAAVSNVTAADRTLDTFRRRPLTDTYYAEGANAGDVNKDGHPDLVYGPHWYEGPEFKTAHEIYAAKPQPLNFYADNFFNWVYDFNGDGWNDVLVVALPGTPGFVYENPKGADGHWPKHQVFDSVGNESPQFLNVVGDEKPELVCLFADKYGFAKFDPKKPFEKWTFQAVSDQGVPGPFAHGLGVGDVNGDKRLDLLVAKGWYEQPGNGEAEDWPFHAADFTPHYGGADMFAYDVDGDGDNDVITSLAAHDFGLAWYEQKTEDSKAVFVPHVIMNEKPEENPYGLVFTELHSVALVDMDGDGLKDIVTGKTFRSHHDRSPMWDAGPVVYWFRLDRSGDQVNWIPYLADGESGIGRQLTVTDVNDDKLPDIVVGGMAGGHVLIHERKPVDQATWDAAQPKLRTAK